MKKIIYIAVPILLVLVMVAVGTVWLFFGASEEAPPGDDSQETKAITLYDAQGNVLITTKTGTDIYDKENWAYLEMALTEAAQLIAQKEACSVSEAQQRLFTQGYQIYTAFDSAAYEALKTVKARWGETCNTACAITDLKGSLLAVYSTDLEDKQINYAIERRSPYSSFKALSVYTPALEKGIANWSTMYEDSPYKQLADDTGKLQDWPANATGTYSREGLAVYEALRTSLNTVAVKCLADLGITESMAFLQDSLGTPLSEEEYVVQHYGEEEVIGNIALGYLETGITPVEMAGYYQMFANGGSYSSPKTVQGIKLEDGTAWYTRQDTSKQVISPGTADTMNKLLQGVVAAGGTGEQAYCSDVQVAGKTGTGDNYADNWFVGVTPGYSLAVWHGQHESNQAAQMFATVIRELYSKLPNANREFVTHHNLHQVAYCVHSGKAFGAACTQIEVGYYASKDMLPVCDTCGKP